MIGKPTRFLSLRWLLVLLSGLVWITMGSTAASEARSHFASSSLAPKGGAETFYRTMSQAHYDQLVATGKLPATAETFISPTKAFAANYDGVLVEFSMQPGTSQALRSIGVRVLSGYTS